MHEWGQPLFVQYHQWSLEVEQAPFAHAIARCYLHGHSSMSISYLKSLMIFKLHVAIVSSKLTGFVKSNRRI